jgi:D-lactate dehydrogenase
VLDISEALQELVLPRLAIEPIDATVAVHPVCSVRKQGLDGTLRAVAAACATAVVQPERVGCCGWAGDKGWTTPELNAHALRDLRESLPPGCSQGYSSSRTCEIGLAQHSGVTYRSIVHLVDAASRGEARDTG